MGGWTRLPARGGAQALVIDLAFVIEGTTEEELPERLLGAVRLHRINLKEERLVLPPKPAADDDDSARSRSSSSSWWSSSGKTKA